MRGRAFTVRRSDGVSRVVLAIAATLTMIMASLVMVAGLPQQASARGPAYSGPQTQEVGPAYFGPAPNPLPYCDSPTYFDPWIENVAPTGRLDVGDQAVVTTDGLTMRFEVTAEGNPGTQYPGFFPFAGEGVPNDQAKGIEMAEGDAAVITLDQPLFYSQWIFTDVDQPGEGFSVEPTWTEVGEVVAYGGDDQFTFINLNGQTTPLNIVLDDVDGLSQDSQNVEGRAQIDLLGAVTGISFERTFPSQGQSGAVVAGGCEASGAAKRIASGPVWNGSSFDVTYELRLRNNLPTTETILDVVNEAQLNAQTTFLTAQPPGIPLENLQLVDQLGDPAFSDIQITNLSTVTPTLDLNESYNGLDDDELLDPGSFIPAETDGLILLSVSYTPDLARAEWTNCSTGYDYLNQSVVSGVAANVAVNDESDDGIDPTPSSNNGAGGVDDPTEVQFPCIPAGLDIVKTALAGPGATCPAFAGGVSGPGTPLVVTEGDTVTYCVTVTNNTTGLATDVAVTDPQAPATFPVLPTLAAGAEQTFTYDLVVDLNTPSTNTATAVGADSFGDLGPVSDTAIIDVRATPEPNLEIVKTVLVGPAATCPDFAGGTPGIGDPLVVDDGATVTYCISARNSGPGDATNVVVSDAQAPGNFVIGALPSGQEVTRSFDLEVDLTTPDTNTAFVDGDGPGGALPQVSDQAEIDVRPLETALEIVKTAFVGPTATCPDFAGGTDGIGTPLVVTNGDIVTYCISVRNTGPGAATNVVVSDAQAPANLPIGSLGAGAERTVSYDITATLATASTNTAFADGDGPGGALPQVSDQAEIDVQPIPQPNLDIVKTVIEGPGGTCPDFDGGTRGIGTPVQISDGDTVTYCVAVRNNGQGVATDVVVQDSQAPGPVAVGTLQPGAGDAFDYDVQVSLATPRTNTATVTGVGPDGEDLPPVSDQAIIAIERLPEPVLEIVKTALRGPNASCPVFDLGVQGEGPALELLETETVTYCLTIRNSGPGDAQNVAIADQQALNTFDLDIGDLASGQELTRQFDLQVSTQTNPRNVATVDGDGPYGAVRQDSDDALISVSRRPDPILEIVKTAIAGPNGDCPTSLVTGIDGDGDPLEVFYGDTVTFCLTVANTGQGDANQVVIDDPQAPGQFTIGLLPAGQERSRSYDVVVDDTTPPRNTATVSGNGPNGSVPTDSDSALIDPGPQPDPVLEIVKTVVPGPNGTCPNFAAGVDGDGEALSVLYGDTVTYCISIRNSGGNPATAVRIDDDQAPGVFAIGTLAVGATRDRTYDVVVDADTDPLNIAEVNGVGPNGDLPSDDDTALIDPRPQPDPVLEIVKTVVLGPNGECPSFGEGVDGRGDPLTVEVGDTVTYCLAIRNSGLRDAQDVTIRDDQAPQPSYDIGLLAPNATASVSYDVEIAADTQLINLAVVSGNGPNGPVPDDRDDAEIEVNVRNPNIALVHTVIRTDRQCEQTVQDVDILVVDLEGLDVLWCMQITNTGNVPLTNVELNAPDVEVVGIDALDKAGERLTKEDSQPQDTLDGASALGAFAEPLIVLMPGQTVALEILTNIPGGGLISVADVNADPSDEQGTLLGLPEVFDMDDAEVREGLIQLEKTVVAGENGDCTEAVELVTVAVGAPVTWCFEVTNVGSIALQVDEIVDDTLGFTVPVPQNLRRMDPAATYVLKTSGASPGEIVNTAMVSGLALDTDGTVLTQAPILRDTDTAALAVAEADLAIDKTVSDAGPVPVGTELTYTLTVTNAGPQAATGVLVQDMLPTGLSYLTLPGDADWACALGADERSFACLKATTMEVDESATLTYTVVVDATAPAATTFENVATVTADTPDPDDSDNTDTSTTQTNDPPDEVLPRVELPPLPEYPGPFDPPAPPPAAEVPDEVLGLAITGSSSRLLGLLSATMLTVGGLLLVGARRTRRGDEVS